MEPIVFLGQLIMGIVGVLCNFEHEQYPSNSVDPWCLIIEYLNDSIVFLGGLVRVHNTPPHVKQYVTKPNVFIG
jgi:hypothetical protein